MLNLSLLSPEFFLRRASRTVICRSNFQERNMEIQGTITGITEVLSRPQSMLYRIAVYAMGLAKACQGFVNGLFNSITIFISILSL
ncbi:uncharacterized protein G2W53_028613 [Senna tora]|uniref:Uncharacterized protein n=1 Tax=Senna tora TaxID=362788 RepID=A0A834T2N0_9FABA|nr:uncharacterized protein G2W53_028613 [Senna tora]